MSEPPSTFKAGDVNNYEENKVDDKFKDQGAWVIRARDERNRDIIYALSTTCTHLGCTPNWLEGEKKFKCPCHGSGFKISGVNFEGPAPRPLERYAIKKSDDGQLVVDKSRKFQKELGQWDDADSYILLCQGKIRISNFEIRNKFGLENRKRACRFLIRISDLFRISRFGIRIFGDETRDP